LLINPLPSRLFARIKAVSAKGQNHAHSGNRGRIGAVRHVVKVWRQGWEAITPYDRPFWRAFAAFGII
jgi:hypothetical protein